MKRVNIITQDNNSGLSRDAAILTRILTEAGFQVTVYPLGKPTIAHKFQRIATYLHQAASYTFTANPPYDINLFLETVVPSWFSYARINCLIPNQEWFRPEWLPNLPPFDYILCKTKFAQRIFDELRCRTEFISFTSIDQFNDQYPKNYDRFFHIPGSSVQKGTKTIIKLWQRHPEWPSLTIRQNPKKGSPAIAPNIDYITEYLDDEVLREYQNAHGIHLCPSEAEGFGHYIGEAMSCKAVTITTNAPPMNELIAPERGLLADYNRTQVQGLGINYYVDSEALEQKIDEVLGMDWATKKQLGEKARDWYEQNDQFFRRRIVEVLKEM